MTEKISLAHGDGGSMTHRLVQEVFQKAFNDPSLQAEEDAAYLLATSQHLRLSTDSFVISPLEFPGGDIGKLAIAGTVNDVAVSGAVPRYISVGFILEEGLELSLLKRVVHSMAATAQQAGVRIVAGDTKVVEKGLCDGMYINTTGIGFQEDPNRLSFSSVLPGDRVIINGGVAEHAVAVLAKRAGIHFPSGLRSDCQVLNRMIQDLLQRFPTIRFLRDPTRGGIATTVKEIAEQARVNIKIMEERIPIKQEVQGALEILGMDPFYLANEGKLIVIAASEEAEDIVAYLRNEHNQPMACEIGYVTAGTGEVLLHTPYGGTRKWKRMSGTPLPRIC
ncbi:hydrogenase expression/formation protein HypE [Brevibacillus parabrevis]|uniref:hydrogenase expression/formation protein HypE n=1 Tax=Brevibacillus parabrevis TaxID=54914 RepID=UPI0007ABD352|nr:hydrogenase expression/formation protein HypE [Brevibacillus parabrevis]KZE43341.1 hydrogenase expression/formation protein HypE [Brevibacillus parabrevis]